MFAQQVRRAEQQLHALRSGHALPGVKSLVGFFHRAVAVLHRSLLENSHHLVGTRRIGGSGFFRRGDAFAADHQRVLAPEFRLYLGQRRQHGCAILRLRKVGERLIGEFPALNFNFGCGHGVSPSAPIGVYDGLLLRERYRQTTILLNPGMANKRCRPAAVRNDEPGRPCRHSERSEESLLLVPPAKTLGGIPHWAQNDMQKPTLALTYGGLSESRARHWLRKRR